jgi:CheY-like chemotaxis protein
VFRTILCVDDDRGPLDTLTEALGIQDNRFLHTANPDEALGWVQTEKLDLILIEIALASGDGLALLEQIRSCRAEVIQPPIVVLTQLEREPECYGRSLELGARDFLTKPVSRGQLLDCVRTFCAKTQTVVDVAHRAEDGPCETMLSNDLASLPLPGLLHQLHARGASGVLIVERTGGRTAVQLRNGSFVSTSSGKNLESFEDFLVRTKRIDQEQREAFIDQMSVGTGSRSEILIGMGVMSESEVTAALFDHADQGLVDAFAWPAPRLRFLPGKKLKPSNSTELNRSVGSTILRGVMARLPIETIRAALEEKGPLFVVEGEDPLYPLEELELDSSQKAFLEEIDADRTVSDLRADGEAVERMLYGFSSIGMVELSAEPPLMLMDVVEQEAEPEKPDAQPSVAPSDEGDADRAKLSPSDPRVEGTSALETLRGMLSDLVERMSAQDDFEVLGIAETAWNASLHSTRTSERSWTRQGSASPRPSRICGPPSFAPAWWHSAWSTRSRRRPRSSPSVPSKRRAGSAKETAFSPSEATRRPSRPSAWPHIWIPRKASTSPTSGTPSTSRSPTTS